MLETGGLFNLAKFMVSIIHNELHGNVKKLRHNEFGGHADWSIHSNLNRTVCVLEGRVRGTFFFCILATAARKCLACQKTFDSIRLCPMLLLHNNIT